MNVRADHVVSSYSDAVSLLARHSAPLRSSSTSAGPSPPNVSTSIRTTRRPIGQRPHWLVRKETQKKNS
eukprot:scaffold61512_cov49-Phaeocystis_antarctica.AAC.1